MNYSLLPLAPAPVPAMSDYQRSSPDKQFSDTAVDRAVKACRWCRQYKVKCEGAEKPPCKRCAKSSRACVIDRRYDLEPEDRLWRHGIEQKLDRLGSNMEKLSESLRTYISKAPEALRDPQFGTLSASMTQFEEAMYPLNFGNPTFDGRIDDFSNATSPSSIPPVSFALGALMDEGSFDPSLGTLPNTFSPDNYTYDTDESHEQPALKRARMDTTFPEPSLVDLRILTADEAVELFDFFQKKLAPYLYGLNMIRQGYDKIAAQSPILLASICTVAALHHPHLNNKFETCKVDLQRLAGECAVCEDTPPRQTGLDTITALCIASFWLVDLSWMLSGIAVRLATRLDLHHSFNRVMDYRRTQAQDMITNSSGSSRTVEDNEDSLDELRLYYILFILDRQQSVVASRPPMMQIDASMPKSHLAILRQNSPADDFRLVLQLQLNLVLSRIFTLALGSPPPPEAFGVTHQTNFELDSWITSWAIRLSPTRGESVWFTKAVLLHYHYAKLYVNSAVVRDVELNQTHDGVVAINTSLAAAYNRDFEAAMLAAVSLLELVSEDKEMQRALGFAPQYIQTMLFYGAMFVMKTLGMSRRFNKLELFGLVSKLRQIMHEQATVCQRHLPHNLAIALDSVLQMAQERHPDVVASQGVKPTKPQQHITGWPGSMAHWHASEDWILQSPPSA